MSSKYSSKYSTRSNCSYRQSNVYNQLYRGYEELLQDLDIPEPCRPSRRRDEQLRTYMNEQVYVQPTQYSQRTHESMRPPSNPPRKERQKNPYLRYLQNANIEKKVDKRKQLQEALNEIKQFKSSIASVSSYISTASSSDSTASLPLSQQLQPIPTQPKNAYIPKSPKETKVSQEKARTEQTKDDFFRRMREIQSTFRFQSNQRSSVPDSIKYSAIRSSSNPILRTTPPVKESTIQMKSSTPSIPMKQIPHFQETPSDAGSSKKASIQKETPSKKNEEETPQMMRIKQEISTKSEINKIIDEAKAAHPTNVEREQPSAKEVISEIPEKSETPEKSPAEVQDEETTKKETNKTPESIKSLPPVVYDIEKDVVSEINSIDIEMSKNDLTSESLALQSMMTEDDPDSKKKIMELFLDKKMIETELQQLQQQVIELKEGHIATSLMIGRAEAEKKINKQFLEREKQRGAEIERINAQSSEEEKQELTDDEMTPEKIFEMIQKKKSMEAAREELRNLMETVYMLEEEKHKKLIHAAHVKQMLQHRLTFEQKWTNESQQIYDTQLRKVKDLREQAKTLKDQVDEAEKIHQIRKMECKLAVKNLEAIVDMLKGKQELPPGQYISVSRAIELYTELKHAADEGILGIEYMQKFIENHPEFGLSNHVENLQNT